MGESRYPYQCYRMLRNLDRIGRIIWAIKIREILFLNTFGYVWVYENIGDVNIFMTVFKQRVIDCGIQEWHHALNESSKARYYKYFMTELKVANYIFYKNFTALSYSTFKSKMLCSLINVEIGRHNDISYEERICGLCNTQSVEDEFHLIIDCPAYSGLRETYSYFI